jgi:hypothetical protein
MPSSNAPPSRAPTSAQPKASSPDKPILQVGSIVWYWWYDHLPGISSLGEAVLVPYPALVTRVVDEENGGTISATLFFTDHQEYRDTLMYSPKLPGYWSWPEGS